MVINKIAGFLAPVLIYLLIFILNLLLPGKWVTGYINKINSEEKLRYHLNGILVFFVIILLWTGLGIFNILPFDWLYDNRWYSLTGAVLLGTFFSLAVIMPYPRIRKSSIADLFLGRAENIQFRGGRIDLKMWLYLSGAIMLELNVLSFAFHHMIVYNNQASTGIIISASLFTWFVIDYLVFERVHLYTYDIFAEKVGFKLGWGCIVFYPYFYPVSLWITADLPDPQTPSWLFIIYVLIFLSGWVLARGANMQKYYFKTDPEKRFLWIIPGTIGDGHRTLLVNGFWGLSRHINYLGEILMAVGIVLCTGYPEMLLPWLYPLYYVLLLFTRQYYDDKRCTRKYGELWSVYKKKVPYRIIPYIY